MALASIALADVITYTVAEDQTQPVNGFAGNGLVTGTFLLCEKPDTFFAAKGMCGHISVGKFFEGNVSDSIVFSVGKVAGTISVAFCSDNGPKDNDDKFCNASPATTGAFGLQEAGPEYGIEETIYTPTNKQPGYATVGTATIEWKLISDTPEPATLGVAAATLAAFWMARRNRRRHGSSKP